MPCALSFSQIVPPAGWGIANALATSVATRSCEVPACRYMRFGYVCAGADANQRSQIGNVLASDQ